MKDIGSEVHILKQETRLLQNTIKVIDEKMTKTRDDGAEFKLDIYVKYASLFDDHTVLSHQVAELRDEIDELRQLCTSLYEGIHT